MKRVVPVFSKQEKDIITMSLMYFKNDYTPEDAEELGFDIQLRGEVGDCRQLEDITQELIEDFIGPSWDEKTTADNVANIQKRMKRG